MIRIDEIEYVYDSHEWDDLNEVCETDLQNWEPISRRFFRSLAKTAQVVVDVGAYTGIYSIESSLSNQNCKVISIEPNPIVARVLESNIEINQIKNVDIFKFALGSSEGEQKLYITAKPFGSSMSSLIPSVDLEMQFNVQVNTINNICRHTKVDLIKIDVEGFEKDILEGSKDILLRDRPVILTEALTSENLLEQTRFMSSVNYSPPINAGHSSGDQRNYFWFATESNESYKSKFRSGGDERI